MDYEIGSSNISYFEYKAINDLMHSHIDEFGKDFRAMIAVGPLVTGAVIYEIELIEVVNEWKGPASLLFSSTDSLPLRGSLHLHFLSASAFESLASDGAQSLRDLLREGYTVVYEVPAGYARRVLTQSLASDTETVSTDYSHAEGRSPDPRKPLLR